MKDYKNQAYMTYKSVKKNSNIVNFQVENGLSFTQTVSQATYRPGDKITYTINVINSSNRSYSNVQITDTLGLYFYKEKGYNPLGYINGTIKRYRNGQPFSPYIDFSKTKVRIINLDILPYDKITIIYQVSLTEYAPYEIIDENLSQITNTATLIANEIDDTIEASSIITAEPFSDLSLAVWLTPNPIIENQKVTYSFIFENKGNTPVTSGTIINDTFFHPITIEKVIFNDTEWIEDIQFTYSNLTHVFESQGDNIEVPAATYQFDDAQGLITVPGTSMLTIYGTVK